MTSTKYCPDCQVEKPENEFYQHKKAKDGLSTYCKSCVAQKARLWYHQNSEKSNQRRNQYNKDNPEKQTEFYARLAADSVRLEKRKKHHQQYRKKRYAKDKQKALLLSRKVE